jgi:O-antigen ligase
MTPPRWHLRFSIGALCLMLIAPFLNPHHYNPIPTFYQEWTAAALGLLAATLLLRREIQSQLEVPGIALLPLGLITLLLAQFASGQIEFLTQALIFVLYLLWAMLLLILGRSLRQQSGLEGLITPLAYALLTGGTLAAALQGLQLSGSPLGFVLQRTGGGGNLAQTNHLANYLWLALASAMYLHAQGKLGKLSFALLTLGLLASASLTGSRSVLLYAIGFALLAAWSAWRWNAPALQKVFYVSLLLLPSTLLLQFAFTWLDAGNSLGTTVSGDRFFQEVSGTSQRLQLWRTALAAFAQHPLLGAGVGQFPWNAYVLVGTQADGTFIGGAEHAHNLFIHLLAEFGLIAPLLTLALGLRWWLGFVRQAWTPAHWWIAAVLLIEAVHSQLEYPLWYAYFLGITAIALGAGSTSCIRPQITRTGRAIVALILLLGGFTLFNLGNDYRKLEHSLNWQLESGSSQAWEKTLDALGRLHRESLLSHYVDLVYAYQLAPDRTALKDKILVCQRAVRFSPVDRITYKLAILLALDGRQEDAAEALRRALATHPGMREDATRHITELSSIYPEMKSLLDQLAAVKTGLDAISEGN